MLASSVWGQASGLQAFALPAPSMATLGDSRMIELTALRVMTIVPAPDASIPLLDARGARLGPVLDEIQFCELATAGSGVIEGASYRVTGTARTPQVNCRRAYSRLARKMPVAAGALGRSVFVRIESAHGLGARDFKLVPWRSVASAAFPVGRVLYVPALRGWRIDADRTHDGFVFVADALADAPRERLALLVESGSSDIPLRGHAFLANDTALRDALHALHDAPIGKMQ